MGEPVKIADLARQLIQLSGLTEQDIRIEYSGLRPGEKLYEEPLADDEKTLPTPHPKLRVARGRTPQNHMFVDEVLRWIAAASDTSANAVRERLHAWVPEYAPGRAAPQAGALLEPKTSGQVSPFPGRLRKH
jgi:FlaA1/EpsC-like NDP-sugar epimerase